MIELPVFDKSGKTVGSMQVDPASLGNEVRPALLKQAYVAVHTHQRQGSARTKSRGDVEGSTRKVYKQKGTGNARVGAARVPNRKGGGVAFKKDRTREAFRSALPARMKRLANRNALLAKLVDNEVKCFDSLSFSQPKTSDFSKMLEAVGIDRTCLVAIDFGNINGRLSARNLGGVDVVRIDQLNVFDLLNHRYLVVDRASLEAFIAGTVYDKSQSKEVA
ncbi:MAG: 50S ribosomal protein L4 [Planctomycetota bacterium]|nr:50S ribosomal protein L4 [Planctomycetota bacterium]MDA1105247.1 50S ribosomal protein L4 [Planctomycetota bacterium]